MTPDPTQPFVILRCPACSATIDSLDETVICQYCGTRLIRSSTTPVQHSAESTGQPASSSVIRGMKFVTYTCKDTQGTNMDVFKVLIPSGWQTTGGVQWLQDNPGMPAVISFCLSNPSGPEAFEVFPNQPFFWSTNPMTWMTNPPGSKYFGNEVRQPMPAQQALREIIVPRFRGNRSINVTKEDHIPGLLDQVRTVPKAAFDQTQSDGAKIRIQYPQDNQQIEEEIFAVVEMNRTMAPSMVGMVEMIFWMIDYLFSFRAKSGQLDASSDLFRTILTSFRLNQQWFARFQQISQYLIQNQITHINNVGQISQFISQTYNQISDQNLQGFYERNQMMDNIAQQMSQANRGVESFLDPNSGNNIELPAGYNQAWTNPLGEVIVSDDPNYDPNKETDQNWTLLNRQG
jgi:hypothetical protein